MGHVPVGVRIRSERKAHGLTQAELAKRAGISPSYLNLIEADKREIGGALLNRIAAELNVAADRLSGYAEWSIIADLEEVALEPLVRAAAPAADHAKDLVARHPDWARALLTLYRAWRDEKAVAGALTDRLGQDPVLGSAVHELLSHVTAIRSSSEILDSLSELDDEERQRFREVISVESRELWEAAPRLAHLFDSSGTVYRATTPAEEVEDFVLHHHFWFPALEQAGDGIRKGLSLHGGTDEQALTGYLRRRHAFGVRRLTTHVAGTGGFHNATRVDAEARRITFLPTAPRPTRRFQLAREIARIEAAAAIEAQLDDPLLTSDAAREQARHTLASYVAGVVVLPYAPFLRAATECRWDIDVLVQRHDASFEQVFHRLTTLRDPDRPGVPFAFLRADPSGFMTKRFPLPNLPLPRIGHACPLWAIFTSFQTPRRTIRSLAEFPGGARYLMVARAAAKPPASFNETPFLQSIMIICDVLHAGRTVYAGGLDLAAATAATPVGPGCRLCPRPACRFRNAAPIVTPAPA